jgi:hypothetical protein
LDLNMGYYHIKLDADAQKLCTIVFPWHMGNYKYKRLPMGIKIVPDVFQNVMSMLVQDMEYVKTYLDDLLIIKNSNFKDHLLKLEMVLARLSIAGMRVNISKSKFFAEHIEYLGYWITRQGIQPIRNEAILNIKAPKTSKSKQKSRILD